MSARLIFGADEAALDQLAAIEYQALYPSIFKRRIAIGRDGIKSISYDVTEAPTFSLTTPLGAGEAQAAELKVELSSRMDELAAAAAGDNDPGSWGEELVALAATAAADRIQFSLDAASVKFTVEADDGSTHDWPASMTSQCSFSTKPPNVVRMVVETALVKFTGPDPSETLEWLINNAVLPTLVQEFNNDYLGPIQVPLQFGDVTLQLPDVSVVDGTLIAVSNPLGEPSPDFPPPGTAWPKGRAFLVMDTDLVDTFVDEGLDTVSKAGNSTMQRWGITFGARYFLGLRNARISFAARSPFPGQVEAAGTGVISAKAGRFTLAEARLIASASPTFDVAPSIAWPNFDVEFEALTGQNVKIEIPWLPKPIAHRVEELVEWLNGPLTTLLGNLLLAWRNTLHLQIPPIQMKLPDVTLDFALRDPRPVGISCSDGVDRIGMDGFFELDPD